MASRGWNDGAAISLIVQLNRAIRPFLYYFLFIQKKLLALIKLGGADLGWIMNHPPRAGVKCLRVGAGLAALHRMKSNLNSSAAPLLHLFVIPAKGEGGVSGRMRPAAETASPCLGERVLQGGTQTENAAEAAPKKREYCFHFRDWLPAFAGMMGFTRRARLSPSQILNGNTP
jgi:hypothetical protein